MTAWLAALVLTACNSSPTATVRHSSSQAGSPGSAHCGPAGAKTLVADSAARVYVSAPLKPGATVYGCASATGHSYALGSAGSCLVAARAEPVALAGVTVAYGLKLCETDFGTAQVVIRSLGDGRRLRVLPALTRFAAPESYGSVTDLVVRGDGAVAWISLRSSLIGRRTETEVHTADASGAMLRDSGPGISRQSLTLAGSTVAWRDHGALRSAPLH